MFFNQSKFQFNSTNFNPNSYLVFQILISNNTISISKYQTDAGLLTKQTTKISNNSIKQWMVGGFP